MNRKFFIVSNPFSGQGKAQHALMRLKKRLDKEGFFYAIFLTPKSENLDEFIEENLFTDTTDLVVIGGDGTINACVNVIHDKDMTMSIIPCGSGNDFIKTIDIGSGLDEHINTIIEGKERTIDLGDCNGKKFVNGVGVGFDGQIVHDNIYSKSLFTGHAKYFLLVLKILGSYRSRHMQFEIDGQKYEDRLITMAIHNGTTFGGGFKLNPKGVIDDGLLNICTIGRIPAWKRFINIGKLSFGQHGSLKSVKFFTAKEIFIYKNPKTLLAQIDGEYFGEPPLKITILPKTLKIRVK
ncbi:MAG: diacylglycerol kinase family lipid kinase [Reichenbachiella sp.]